MSTLNNDFDPIRDHAAYMGVARKFTAVRTPDPVCSKILASMEAGERISWDHARYLDGMAARSQLTTLG